MEVVRESMTEIEKKNLKREMKPGPKRSKKLKVHKSSADEGGTDEGGADQGGAEPDKLVYIFILYIYKLKLFFLLRIYHLIL